MILDQKGEENNTISITVDSTRGSIELEVLKTVKVQEVIEISTSKLGLEKPEEYELFYAGQSMKRERPLVSYGVKDGDHLDLVRIAAGG